MSKVLIVDESNKMNQSSTGCLNNNYTNDDNNNNNMVQLSNYKPSYTNPFPLFKTHKDIEIVKQDSKKSKKVRKKPTNDNIKEINDNYDDNDNFLFRTRRKTLKLEANIRRKINSLDDTASDEFWHSGVELPNVSDLVYQQYILQCFCFVCNTQIDLTPFSHHQDTNLTHPPVLLCDGDDQRCVNACHLSCHAPALAVVPYGKWYCPFHRFEQEKQQQHQKQNYEHFYPIREYGMAIDINTALNNEPNPTKREQMELEINLAQNTFIFPSSSSSDLKHKNNDNESSDKNSSLNQFLQNRFKLTMNDFWSQSIIDTCRDNIIADKQRIAILHQQLGAQPPSTSSTALVQDDICDSNNKNNNKQNNKNLEDNFEIPRNHLNNSGYIPLTSTDLTSTSDEPRTPSNYWNIAEQHYYIELYRDLQRQQNVVLHAEEKRVQSANNPTVSTTHDIPMTTPIHNYDDKFKSDHDETITTTTTTTTTSTKTNNQNRQEPSGHTISTTKLTDSQGSHTTDNFNIALIKEDKLILNNKGKNNNNSSKQQQTKTSSSQSSVSSLHAHNAKFFFHSRPSPLLPPRSATADRPIDGRYHVDNTKNEYLLSRVITHKEYQQRGKPTQYWFEVFWMGYTAEENTIEPPAHLTDCKAIVWDYCQSINRIDIFHKIWPNERTQKYERGDSEFLRTSQNFANEVEMLLKKSIYEDQSETDEIVTNISNSTDITTSDLSKQGGINKTDVILADIPQFTKKQRGKLNLQSSALETIKKSIPSSNSKLIDSLTAAGVNEMG